MTMVVPKSAAKGKTEADDGEDFGEVYKELVKAVEKEAKKVKV